MTEERKLICCICDKPIPPDLTTDGEVYWDQGHNPQPVSTVKGDRCCTDCNNTVITPRRLVEWAFDNNHDALPSLKQAIRLAEEIEKDRAAAFTGSKGDDNA